MSTPSRGEPNPPAGERPSLFTPLVAPEPGDGGGAGKAKDDEPVLPTRSEDDGDVGWGERPDESDDDRYQSERPPHWE